MRVLPRRTLWSLVLILCLVAILGALAALQYRWVGQLSEDRRVILRTRLEGKGGEQRTRGGPVAGE